MSIIGEQTYRFEGTMSGDLSKLGAFQTELTALAEKHKAVLERFAPYTPRANGKQRKPKIEAAKP